MTFDDMLDDGETQACPSGFAAARRIDAIEALGDPRQVFARNARTVIADGHSDRCPSSLGPDLDLRVRTIASITQGIAEEIVEDLEQLRAIASDRRQARRDIDGELALPGAAAIRPVFGALTP